MHEKIELSGQWQFKCDPNDEGIKQGYPSSDAAGWEAINVPGSFDSPSGAHPAGAAWYSLAVSVPQEWQGKKIILQFQAVNDRASIWVNGVHCGSHDLPFLPFSVPIENAVRFGESNRITVRVDNKLRRGGIPCSGEYFRPQGGIIREVRLLAVEHVRLRDLQVIAEPSGNDGRFTINAFVVNDQPEPVKVSLRLKVWNHDCRARWNFHFGPLIIPAQWKTEIKLPGHISDVTMWSPENPTLFVAEVELLKDVQSIDIMTSKFGFRKIEARGDQLWLNGRLIHLRGFCYFEDSPRTGMASDRELFRSDLTTIKEMGGNFVRLCGHPHHPYELDICDEIGLLAMAEIPVCGVDALKDPASFDTAQKILRLLIQRDRHHPSVISWSVSDGIAEENPEVAKRNYGLIELAKTLDRPRLATHISERTRWLNPEIKNMYQNDDVICLGGCFSETGRVALKDSSYDFAESARAWQQGISGVKSRYPVKPVIAAAIGYPSVNDVDGGSGEAVQAQAIEAEYAGLREAGVPGCVIRSFADHLVELDGKPAICPCGVVRRDRTRKPAFETVERLFQSIPAIGAS